MTHALTNTLKDPTAAAADYGVLPLPLLLAAAAADSRPTDARETATTHRRRRGVESKKPTYV